MTEYLQNVVKLTEDDRWTVASYLRSAAAKFEALKQDALLPRPEPCHPLLLQAMQEQAAAAIRFAEMFEQATSVVIEKKEEIS